MDEGLTRLIEIMNTARKADKNKLCIFDNRKLEWIARSEIGRKTLEEKLKGNEQ